MHDKSHNRLGTPLDNSLRIVWKFDTDETEILSKQSGECLSGQDQQAVAYSRQM